MEDDNIRATAFLGYDKILKTIDIVKANRIAFLVFIPAIILYVVPFWFIWKEDINIREILRSATWQTYLKWTIIFFAGIVAHELVHGITWALFTKRGFKSIRFGVMWKMLTPYCHCKEPLKVKHYIIGAITPFIFVGLIPAIYAIIYGSIGWLMFGIIYTVGAVGDFMIINLLKNEKGDDYALDHPSEAGCYVYRKTNSVPANNHE